MITYVLKQKLADGSIWTSPEAFNATEPHHIVQAVTAGYLHGQSRWAESPGGSFIWGLDAKGEPMASAPVSDGPTKDEEARVAALVSKLGDELGKLHDLWIAERNGANWTWYSGLLQRLLKREAPESVFLRSCQRPFGLVFRLEGLEVTVTVSKRKISTTTRRAS